MKEIYEMEGAGRTIRGIAGELRIARNTLRRYLKSPDAMRPNPRPRRASNPSTSSGGFLRRVRRPADVEGLENCVVLHRELRALGYGGGYSILKSLVSPKRRRREPDATMRFETAPGEQAQVDWGSLAYLDQDGKKRRIWVFVMTLGRDEDQMPVWNQRMLDLAMRVDFEVRLCRPYRAQTKGKAESGVKYVKGNMWPSMINDNQSCRWTATARLPAYSGWSAIRQPVRVIVMPAGPAGGPWDETRASATVGHSPHHGPMAAFPAHSGLSRKGE